VVEDPAGFHVFFGYGVFFFDYADVPKAQGFDERLYDGAARQHEQFLFPRKQARRPDLGGHPKPANGGHLKTGQRKSG
jgi:hypothetical protein